MMVMVGSWLRRMTARLRRLLGRPRIPGRLRLGGTGGAQVRLELAAEVMREFALELRRTQPPQTDREALLQGLRNRACGGCVLRAGCLERKRLSVKDLEEGTAFPCRKPGRLGRELREARRSLRRMEAQRRRESECLGALEEQYLFLEEYLRRLADRLPRAASGRVSRFGVRAGIRTRRKTSVSGDRWAAFPGDPGRFYILLCDGMGVGPGAREDSRRAIRLLRQLLLAGYPPRYAMRGINALLALENRAGAVTVDLAELRLDTGFAMVYKWGGAPGYLVRGGRTEKIGTAMPPPGLSVTEGREWTARLSLRGGETLILVSDGVDAEAVPRRVCLAPEATPGELAERLLETASGKPEDDATAAVIRLYAVSPGTS